MDKTKRIYWDSCIFIALIADEKRNPGETSGISDVVQEVDANKITLVTSVISRVEVLRDLGIDRDKYINVLKRPNIQETEVNKTIAQMAGDIRHQFQVAGICKLTTPDAIHLATAIYAEVDEFHTFDGEGRQPGLIDLSGHEIIKGLKITKPRSKHPYLPEF
ncbi:MAG: type II toxin-antitoxin system VapC family toxin [Desulfobaccales bacterium]